MNIKISVNQGINKPASRIIGGNAGDSRSADARIWRDQNQDGIAAGHVTARRSLLARFRARLCAAAFGALLGLGLAGGALASDLLYNPASEPAVSAPNGKLSAFGGLRNQDNAGQDGMGGLTGSWSLPLGHAYGLQFDSLLGLRDHDVMGGAGLHLFWRDPNHGLLGITGSWVGWDADRKLGGYTDMFRIGGEAELYLDRLTLEGQIGAQFGENTKDGFYGRADLKYYATPDLALKIGAEYNEQVEGLGRIGLEFQPDLPAIPGLTLFADAAVGGDGHNQVFIGLRIYFGGSKKSLRDRHRRDDPKSTLRDNISMIGRGNITRPVVVVSPPTTPTPKPKPPTPPTTTPPTTTPPTTTPPTTTPPTTTPPTTTPPTTTPPTTTPPTTTPPTTTPPTTTPPTTTPPTTTPPTTTPPTTTPPTTTPPTTTPPTTTPPPTTGPRTPPPTAASCRARGLVLITTTGRPAICGIPPRIDR